jgi:hypothetical protein
VLARISTMINADDADAAHESHDDPEGARYGLRDCRNVDGFVTTVYADFFYKSRKYDPVSSLSS